MHAPAETGAPLSRSSSTELATEVITRGIAETISAATVRRWLAADAIKPWQHRSWIFPRDADFGAKAARVLDLYARQWQGHPLGPNDYVISAGEIAAASPAPPPSGTTARTRANPARGVRVPPRRYPGVLRRLRRPSGPGARPDRPQDRHRTLREAGGPRHDDRTVCLGPTSVLGRRQRLVAQHPIVGERLERVRAVPGLRRRDPTGHLLDERHRILECPLPQSGQRPRALPISYVESHWG